MIFRRRNWTIKAIWSALEKRKQYPFSFPWQFYCPLKLYYMHLVDPPDRSVPDTNMIIAIYIHVIDLSNDSIYLNTNSGNINTSQMIAHVRSLGSLWSFIFRGYYSTVEHAQRIYI